jgi:ketosteroid isomerase-like protein
MEDLKELFTKMVKTFEAKDLEGALKFFAEDAVFIDPHYPQSEMRGKAAIRQGMAWAFQTLAQPGFTPLHFWIGGDSGAAEVDTHHTLKGGMRINFRQVFVFETRDGRITRLQSFVPYGPPGIGGFVTRATRLAWKLQGKMKR